MAAVLRFRRRQGHCSACENAFVEGQTLFSLLRTVEDALERGDLCATCFDARDPAADVFYWRTAHRESREKVRVDFPMLLAALESLANDKREACRDFRFLVALLLVRHRKLRLTGVQRRRGREFLVLRKVRTQNLFAVEVRQLDAARRVRLTAILSELLDPTREADLGALLDAGVAEAAELAAAVESSESGVE
ncbi:MAG TPA: hypothetical protein VGC54_12395 [Planctomycetota bacterium]